MTLPHPAAAAPPASARAPEAGAEAGRAPGPEPLTRLRRAVLVGAGTLCVALGTAGLVLPLLPTTPFLLLAAACYARSSPRFLAWLLGNRWFGPFIRNYREERGLPLRQKVVTLVLLWLAIVSAAWLAGPRWWLSALLVATATGVTLFLSSLRTLPSTPRHSTPPCVRPAPSAPETDGEA